MTKPITGYFYRRKKGKHIPIDGDPDAQIYYACRSHGSRMVICCHTTNFATAKKRLMPLVKLQTLTNEEQYLAGLVNLGKDAEAQLTKSIVERAGKK